MSVDSTKLIQIPRVNNRLLTLGYGVSWDATVSKSQTEEALALHSQHPDTIYHADNNPFYVAPREARGSFVDLQAIAVGLRREAGYVYYVDGDHSEGLDGAVAHTGDEKTGTTGGGWDELCTVSLGFVPEDVEGIALFVHCKSSHVLSDASNGKYAIFSMRDQSVMMEGELKERNTTRLVGILRRYKDDFVLQPLDLSFNAVTLDDALAAIRNVW